MKLCVALDLATERENLAIVEQLNGLDLWFKIGLRSFIRGGWEFVETVQRTGETPIFLDLKLHDIPNTTADAALEIADRGVEMFNLHATVGKKAMSLTMERLGGRSKRPIVLAVTALTSFAPREFEAIYGRSIDGMARSMALDAHQSGLDGVVCSVYESVAIKAATGERFLTLTPGIRPANAVADDQARVATPSDARSAKADFIVMGRPIIGAKDPREIASTVLGAIV
ncbi:orotidine 5'-phosphate decarboxylase [Campylobacterota bacterium]|nr:orotidine 5'-phosphate decarboxylase [Campylobacterota bacterium]